MTEPDAPDISQVPKPPSTPLLADVAQPAYQGHRFTQWILMAMSSAAFVLFWWIGGLLGVPAHAGYGGSLLRLHGATPIVALIAAIVLIFAVTAVGTRIARSHWRYAGVLAASAGLAAWAWRGGPIRYVLLAPDATQVGSGVFYLLAVETLLLGAIIGAAWLIVLPRFDGTLRVSGRLIEWPGPDLFQGLLTQTVLTGICVMLVVPSGEKKQAFFGVLVACFLATGLTQHFFHDERLAPWFWVGPVVVGVLGYLFNAFGGNAEVATATGYLTGTFAALSRPLPLEYASTGVVGALLGYWIGSEHPEPAVTNPAEVTPSEDTGTAAA